MPGPAGWKPALRALRRSAAFQAASRRRLAASFPRPPFQPGRLEAGATGVPTFPVAAIALDTIGLGSISEQTGNDLARRSMEDFGSPPDRPRAPPGVKIRSRRRLPHLEQEGGTYFVTFGLAGSLPRPVLEKAAAERRTEEARRLLSGSDQEHQDSLEEIDRLLDQGIGFRWLRDPQIAAIVVGALKHFADDRYRLHA
jgi:hypothetical protein